MKCNVRRNQWILVKHSPKENHLKSRQQREDCFTCEGKDTYVGMLVQTDKSGKLNESTYAMFFNKTTNTLEYATYASMGSTGGFDWAYAKAHAGGGDDASTGATALTALLTDDTSSVGAEWRDWESFYVEINSETADDHTDAVPAKTGATRTVTATYNAFNIAARYYYDNYVKGVNAQWKSKTLRLTGCFARTPL